MANIEHALNIAASAHAGQVDKSGQPYILHPLRVMAGVEGDEAKIVGVLHDVVEDTDVNLDDLRSAGFSPAVINAVRLLTHEESVTYADYVIAIKADPIARAVKLSDLRDNARLDRAMLRAESIEKDMKRIRRYVASYQFLVNQVDEPTYRKLMNGAE